MIQCWGGAILIGLILVLPGIQGCGSMDGRGAGEAVVFRNAGEFTDSRGMAKIVLVMYTGNAREADVRQYVGRLGCNLVFAFFYPEGTPPEQVPVRELEEARNFVEARDLLFQGPDTGGWSFASQCLGMIPTITDCRETPGSTNCR
jgi:hypothetical protein